MTGLPEASREALSFGTFELVPAERLLTERGVPVEMGSRTLDTLIALASRPNEPIGKRELMALVWPDATVEEGSLRFHIAALRRALRDGHDGARYIATLAGRGYCFVAPVARSSRPGRRAMPAHVADPRATFLPARLARMVGREDSVSAVASELAASRFVSIVGPGGVGKTAVAVAVAHDLLPAFDGVVLFVDLSLLSDARIVPSSVASMLGIAIHSDDPVPSLIAHLRDRRMLLVLDNCEHVVEAVAQLTERIFLAAPELQILATSREALRVEGERVHRLAPLGVPPDDPGLTAAATLTFPAARLFVERATASGARLDLEDANAAIVASICRKLDGMALAIELAAGRVEAYGLAQTATLLDERFTLQWPGQRTAPARQKTLRATLDWSYGLLSESERVVFRRLAAFVGPFTIEAALAVVANETVDAAWVFAAIDSLVAKSMVTAFPVGAMMRYRLLDTARAYALEITVDRAERAALGARHAAYCLRWLEQSTADGPPQSDAAERAPQLVGLNNVRAALEWCFGPDGDLQLGARLAAAAMSAFLALSLLTECQLWSRRVLLALDDAQRGGPEEMWLETALGLSSMFTRGHSEEARVALTNGLRIAQQRGDSAHQLRLLSLLHMFHHRVGDVRTALEWAKQSSAVSSTIESPASVALAQAQLGISLTLTGDLAGARVEFEAALRQPEIFVQGFDYRVIASGYLARVLWLQGYPAQAAAGTRLNVDSAARSGHPVSLTFALSFAVPLLLWLRDLSGGKDYLAWFLSHTETYSQLLFNAVARGFKGQCAIDRGEMEAGVEILEGSLRDLSAANYNIWMTPFSISRAQGLVGLGRSAEALALIDCTIRQTEENGDLTYIPELLRVKANIFGLMEARAAEAQSCLAQSMNWSRRQGARASELRAAIDLASLHAKHDRLDDARAVLRPVFAAFTEGFETADLQAAERLLASLSLRPAPTP
jgi:predicted ATPase/DNA-binding winged helix-turn-helix (wHTH) protein